MWRGSRYLDERLAAHAQAAPAMVVWVIVVVVVDCARRPAFAPGDRSGCSGLCLGRVLAERGDRRAAEAGLIERRERRAGPEDPRAGAGAARALRPSAGVNRSGTSSISPRTPWRKPARSCRTAEPAASATPRTRETADRAAAAVDEAAALLPDDGRSPSSSAAEAGAWRHPLSLLWTPDSRPERAPEQLGPRRSLLGRWTTVWAHCHSSVIPACHWQRGAPVDSRRPMRW